MCKFFIIFANNTDDLQDHSGYVWILTVLDHFTKYLWAAAFKAKDAPEIAEYLLKVFRDGVCFPERWHADNGGEFKNYHIDAVRELLAANSECVSNMLLPYSHSMPRNPKCQGLVERGNRTVKTTIQKQMTSDGFVIEEHDEWEWVPYLDRVVRGLNRRIVQMYRFSPCVMMTGQPPEAPDHEALSPSDLCRLHIFCADQMKRRAAGMIELAFCPVFARGDVVLVHQVAKRSHKDARGKGSKSYPARAVVVKQSSTNESHYQIRWLTDGLYAKEKTGDVSKIMWVAWKLKKCKTGLGQHATKKQVFEEEQIVAEVLAGAKDPNSVISSDEDKDPLEGAPLTDREAIAQIAERYCTHATIAPCIDRVCEPSVRGNNT
jgi:hypothetical protein